MTIRSASIAIALAAATVGAQVKEDTLVHGVFGRIHVYEGSPRPRRVALFVSGDGGWNLGVVDMARELASGDTWVVGVDITTYFKRIGAAHGSCAYAAADFEELSHFVQKRLGLNDYIVPTLVGYSSGATLVYGTLAQAPRGTFSGAVSLGFCNDLDIAKPLCTGAGLEWRPRSGGRTGTDLLPARKLAEPWIALQGEQDQTCLPEATAAFVKQVPGARMIPLPKVGHGYSVPRNWMPQFLEAFAATAPASVPLPRRPASTNSTERSVEDLPLVEVPATPGASDSRLAILLTGDGGWAGIDRDIASALSAKGIPVVGWNSLRYFWERKSEAGATSDLARVIEHYRSAWQKDSVIVVGYSLGADAVPAMASGLPADVLAHVSTIALIGIETTYDLEFHVSDWVPGQSEGKPILPLVQKLKGRSILCFYGQDETGSLCPELPGGVAKAIKMPGGHHMNGDYAKLADMIAKRP